MSDAFVHVFGNPICQGKSQSDHMRHLRQSDFPMISRVFHHMITSTISPWANLNYVLQDDVILINAMLQHQPVDVGYLVFRNFHRSLSRRDSHLYSGRLITRIFYTNDFDLTGHRRIKAKKAFTYADIEKRLNFRLDPNTQEYYRNQPMHQQQQEEPAAAPNLGEPSPDI